MSALIKKSIAILGILIAAFALYYGSYLPLKKSRAYIAAAQRLNPQAPNAIASLQEFGDAFDGVLGIPSPVGEEELTKNLAAIVSGLIQANGTQNPELTAALIGYLQHYYDPMLSRSRGLSYAQSLDAIGRAYYYAYEATNDSQYLDQAKRYYSEGLRVSPSRPQFLYSLFALYQAEGNVEEARRIGEEIIRLWPDDAETRAALEELSSASR